MLHHSTSDILYVRAALKPFMEPLRVAGGIREFLQQSFAFSELFVPHFYSARPLWRSAGAGMKATNSGALGKQVAKLPGASLSRHPTHAFAGVGARVVEVLARHDYTKPCFFPIAELGRREDFSMLLLGCVDESPGFSTVHAVQQELGLTQRHLLRLLLRWDVEQGGRRWSITAPEAPGCSLSFGKFYEAYQRDGNLVQGEFWGKPYVFISSARRAMAVERDILQRQPRFVECGRKWCETCRLRTY